MTLEQLREAARLAARTATASKRVRCARASVCEVNLDLRVLGNRWMATTSSARSFSAVALHDTLLCVTRPGPFRAEMPHVGRALDESNLVWRRGRRSGRRGTHGRALRSLDFDQETIP